MRHPTCKGVINGSLTIRGIRNPLKDELREKLTFRNPAYDAAARFSPWGPPKNIPERIKLCLYDDAAKTANVPRGADYRRLLSLKAYAQFRRVQWDDRRVDAPVEMPKALVSLNPDQHRLLRQFIRARDKRLRPFDTYFSVSGTGTGKCIAQAMMARETGQRTLVLCQTNLIKKAWTDDLNMLFGLAEKEIGIIQQSRFRIGEHFTLAMIATMGRRRHVWSDIFSNFGTVILDEADIVSGDTVSELVRNCPCRHIIGASATDDVSRAKGFMLPMLFGTPVERIEVSNDDTPTSMKLTDVVTHDTDFRFDNDGELFDYAELLDAITYATKRNEFIMANAVEDWKTGHTVIVASKRLLHLEILKEMAENAGIPAALLTGETNINRTYTKKLVKDILSRKQRFIVASVDAVKRGANINPADRLHLAVPVTNATALEQLVGRIRRTYPRKRDCIVHYYLDRHVPYLNHRYRRNAIPVFQKLKVARFVDKIYA